MSTRSGGGSISVSWNPLSLIAFDAKYFFIVGLRQQIVADARGLPVTLIAPSESLEIPPDQTRLVVAYLENPRQLRRQKIWLNIETGRRVAWTRRRSGARQRRISRILNLYCFLILGGMHNGTTESGLTRFPDIKSGSEIAEDIGVTRLFRITNRFG